MANLIKYLLYLNSTHLRYKFKLFQNEFETTEQKKVYMDDTSLDYFMEEIIKIIKEKIENINLFLFQILSLKFQFNIEFDIESYIYQILKHNILSDKTYKHDFNIGLDKIPNEKLDNFNKIITDLTKEIEEE